MGNFWEIPPIPWQLYGKLNFQQSCVANGRCRCDPKGEQGESGWRVGISFTQRGMTRQMELCVLEDTCTAAGSHAGPGTCTAALAGAAAGGGGCGRHMEQGNNPCHGEGRGGMYRVALTGRCQTWGDRRAGRCTDLAHGKQQTKRAKVKCETREGINLETYVSNITIEAHGCFAIVLAR